jgi:hypothetical protein
MGHTKTANFAPAAHLPDLLKMFGCANVVAPVDGDAFGKRAGELICRKKAESVTPTAGKYRLRALQCFETAAQSQDPYANTVLTELAREFLQAAGQLEEKKPPGD